MDLTRAVFFLLCLSPTLLKLNVLLTERPEVHFSTLSYELTDGGMDIWVIIPMRNMLIAGRGSHHLRKFIFMFHFFISWRLDRKIQFPIVHSATPVLIWRRASCQDRGKFSRLRCRSFWGLFIVRIGLLSTPEFIYHKIPLRWALHYAVGRFQYVISYRLNSWSLSIINQAARRFAQISDLHSFPFFSPFFH